MKKVLLILFITLFNTSLFAEINEPGSGIINYWYDFEKYMKDTKQSPPCFYSRGDITMPWEKELGIIKENW